MTQRPSFSELPEDHKPIEDADWARAVVSEALVHANTPLEDDDGWMSAADLAAAAEPSAPVEPPKANFDEVSPQAVAEADWVSHDELPPLPTPIRSELRTEPDDAPHAEPVDNAIPARVTNGASVDSVPHFASNGDTSPTRTRELTVELPMLGDDAPDDIVSTDAVMVESEASVEGYRASELRTIVEWLLVIFLALVVAVLAKQFIVQAFWIPTASMETTVNVGDRVLVNKVSYRVNDVRRGDLVVFGRVEGTPGNTEDLIKRAVALPGETIELRSDGRLWIWGPGETPQDALLLDEPYLDVQNALLTPPSPTDGPTSNIWHENCVNDSSNAARCTLDSNSYYMMGDNRSQSFDSRGFGPVPEDNIVGRAFFRIWPLGSISTL